VKRNLLECQRETNLPASPSKADEQARLQGAHGHKERPQGALPPKSQRTPPPHGKRGKVTSAASSEIPQSTPDETRDPARLSNIFTRYSRGTVAPEGRSPMLLPSGLRTEGFPPGWVFCEPERTNSCRAQPRAALDERSISGEQGTPPGPVVTKTSCGEHRVPFAGARRSPATEGNPGKH
jgi:hypothetical protein